ncbi:MAG: hypothetical protein WC802_03485 [Patescibacteria group bacterium]|jgi:hypothetical protein
MKTEEQGRLPLWLVLEMCEYDETAFAGKVEEFDRMVRVIKAEKTRMEGDPMTADSADILEAEGVIEYGADRLRWYRAGIILMTDGLGVSEILVEFKRKYEAALKYSSPGALEEYLGLPRPVLAGDFHELFHAWHDVQECAQPMLRQLTAESATNA